MDTKEKILTGATEVFRKQGFAAARMQDIADHCGVNKALLHYHFGSKKDLFDSILRTAFQELIPSIMASLNGEQPLREKLAQTIGLYMDALAANPNLPLFVLNEVNRNPDFVREHLKERQGSLDRFYEQVYQANVSGELFPVDPFDIVADIIGLSVIGYIARPMLQGISNRSDEDYAHFLSARKAHAVSLLMNGLFRSTV